MNKKNDLVILRTKIQRINKHHNDLFHSNSRHSRVICKQQTYFAKANETRIYVFAFHIMGKRECERKSNNTLRNKTEIVQVIVCLI